MFKVETGTKTVEHKTVTLQQRIVTAAVLASFLGGFMLSDSTATAKANAAARHSQPTQVLSTPLASSTTPEGK